MMAEYADLLYRSRAGSTVAAVNIEYEAAINAVSGGRQQEFSPHNRRRKRRSPSCQGRSSERPLARTRRQRHLLLQHYIRQQGDEAQTRVPVDSGKRTSRQEVNILGGGMIFFQDATVPGGHRRRLQHSTTPITDSAEPAHLRRPMERIVPATVYRPILGLDFLSAHGLLVDPVGRQVPDSKSLKPLSKPKTAAGGPHSKFSAALCSIAPTVRSLLAAFPAIIGNGNGKPSLKHKIRHTIETSGRPVFAKALRLDPDNLRTAEAEFRVGCLSFSRGLSFLQSWAVFPPQSWAVFPPSVMGCLPSSHGLSFLQSWAVFPPSVMGCLSSSVVGCLSSFSHGLSFLQLWAVFPPSQSPLQLSSGPLTPLQYDREGSRDGRG